MKNRITLISIVMVFFSLSTLAQTITLVDPDTGTQCERLTVTITGENTHFSQGTGTLRLQRSGSNTIYPWSTSVHSGTEIEGTFYFNPSHDPGYYNVIAPDANGEIILQDGFLLNEVTNAPELQSIDPDSAYTGHFLVLNIYGINTHFNQGTNQVIWLYCAEDGTTIQNDYMELISDTHLQVGFDISNYATPGTYTLYLSDQLDGNLSLVNALILLAAEDGPEIVSVVPNKGYQGTELTVTVTGKNTNFQQGTSTMFLSMFGYSPIRPNNQTVVNDTVLKGDFTFSYNEILGLYDVVVSKYGEGDVIQADGFRLLSGGSAPFLESIVPQSAPQGSVVHFIIKGENTHFGTPGNMASVTLINGYEELYCHDITVIDSVTLEANYVFSFTNTLGLYDLIIHAPLDGTMRLNNSFELLESTSTAAIVSVNPDTAMQGQSLTISVTGRNIIFMQGTSNLMLSQGNITINPDNQTIVNDTVISGEFNFQTTLPDGFYDVKVDNGYAWPSVILTEGFNLKLFDFVEETNNTSWLNIYPNPAHDYLYIQCSHQTNEIFTIQIMDINGKLLLEDSLTTNESEKQLSLGKLSPGTYLLKVIHGRQQQTSQFLIN